MNRRVAIALLLVAGALGGCSSSADAPATLVSQSGAGGAGEGPLFDLDAGDDSAPAAPHVIDGTALGCPCKLTMDFTALPIGATQTLTVNGATLRASDSATDAAADVPIAVASTSALGGMHVVFLDGPTKSATVVPPAGYFCVIIDYVPTTASVPTVRVGYGATREVVAGPAGGTAQMVLTPKPGFVNTVGLRMTPAIDSVRIYPGAGGGLEVPALCFGTDAPTP
jgi:hypothetical protein